MKYRVLRNNYGFQNQYWTKDEVVEIDPKLNPPKDHFVPAHEAEKPVAKPAVAPEVKHHVPTQIKHPVAHPVAHPVTPHKAK